VTRKAPVNLQRDHPGRRVPEPPTQKTLADQLDALASRVNLIDSRRGDPERFHAEKDDIAVSLRRLARAQRGDTGRKHSTTWRPDDKRS
jgi:hypothetical protein